MAPTYIYIAVAQDVALVFVAVFCESPQAGYDTGAIIFIADHSNREIAAKSLAAHLKRGVYAVVFQTYRYRVSRESSPWRIRRTNNGPAE